MLASNATNKINIYALFGYPLSFTLSPIIHNAIFSKNKLNAFYFAQPVEPQKLKQAIQSLRDFEWSGANITIPHKQSVIKYLDKLDNSAKCVGAVNTIVNENKRLVGYNTDVLGFKHTLPKQLNYNQQVICLGAGGAALAIISALADLGFNNIAIINRTTERAENLISKVKQHYNKLNLQQITWNNVKESDLCNKELIINCTPVDFPLPVKLDLQNILVNSTCIYDLRYGLKSNEFLNKAKQNNTNYIFDGLPMLIWQALYAQKIWCGSLPNVKIVEEAIQKWL